MSKRALAAVLVCVLVFGLTGSWLVFADDALAVIGISTTGSDEPDDVVAVQDRHAMDEDDPAEANPSATAGDPANPDTSEMGTTSDSGADASDPTTDATSRDPDASPAEGGTSESATSNGAGGKTGTGKKTRNPSNGKSATSAKKTDEPKKLRIPPRPRGQSLGNRRPRAKRIKEPKGVKPLADVPQFVRDKRRGAYVAFYEFHENPLTSLLDPEEPALADRSTDHFRIDANVYYPNAEAFSDIGIPTDNFAAQWVGYLKIETAGDYWFFLGSDLAGNVELDGEVILLNEMARDYVEVSNVITLDAGLHPFRIQYVEGENNSPVSELMACNFMYVPDGESKPVPVPEDWFILPEWAWEGVPVIDRIVPDSGEIGDIVTIHGERFGGDSEEPVKPVVTFAGQVAEVIEITASTIKVRVPIGADTGKVVVRRPPADGMNVSEMLPSAPLQFTVTTQFGLIAHWHNLEGWSNYDFIDESMHTPDVVRLEREFAFASREDLDAEFRNNPLACHWEGKLGIPADFVEKGGRRVVQFEAGGRLRVKLGDRTRETEAQPSSEQMRTILDFEIIGTGMEQMLPISIDWTCESGEANFWFSTVTFVQGFTIGTPRPAPGVQNHWFFPPVEPPKPPEVIRAEPITDEEAAAPEAPVFPVSDDTPAIREGDAFRLTVRLFGNSEARAQPPIVTIDDRVVPFTVESEIAKPEFLELVLNCTMPTGVGEGRLIVRHSVVTSPPFQINILNKGLIAYLYDLPNAGGYSKMPDLEALSCFAIRKDRNVNFENANTFDLPFPAETFAIEWFGGLVVEHAGYYRFNCRSDDGVLVWLDGDLVLEDDNLHYQREKESDWIYLTPGTYPFRMQFFENNVHEVCVLEWEARADSDDEETEFLDRQVIRQRNFTWDTHPTLPAKTATGKRTDGSAPE